MAPPANKLKRAKKAQQRRGRPEKDKLASANPAKLLHDAEAAVASGDPATALVLTEAAVRALKPATAANADLLERAGVRLLELGRPDSALDCLLKCAAALPNSGHAKFLYLAQLSSGEAALLYLDRGIELMTAAASASASASSNSSQELASAWCARCELFMTDLCDRPDAEAQCEAALNEALACRPDSAEALQQRASLRLVQQRPDDALADLLRSLELWLPRRRQAAEAGEVADNDEAAGAGEASAATADPDECGLTAEQRLRCAEMLMELGQMESCIDVLDLLMEEDDEVAQVWLLFGLAYSRLSNASAARYHLQRARALVEPGDPVAGEIDQLLSELPPEGEGEDDPDGEGDDANGADAEADDIDDEEFEEGD